MARILNVEITGVASEDIALICCGHVFLDPPDQEIQSDYCAKSADCCTASSLTERGA